MKREIMTTGDGSKTIHLPDLQEQYHSKHGALQEARHVFIEEGYEFYKSLRPETDAIKILEYGFGTGLNALLTAMQATDRKVSYTGVEAFPVTKEEVNAMEYGDLLHQQDLYDKIHQIPWEQPHEITENFELQKRELMFENINFITQFDLVYFDAFGPRTQPELWTLEIFQAAFYAMKSSGVLVTYCAAGQVRRNLQQAGFVIERLPGPPGKREMLRAIKPNIF
jgi:tRNA U34 5-methylaminomethyl-2-thiouridine-forming methyltransferase MnmC